MIIAVDKPLGPTSHDVVARARRQLGTRKVGHAGTLDPLATGLLLILSDEHTRLARFLTAADKTYLAWVSFGGSSPTLDAEGPFTPAHKVPSVAELRERLPELFAPFLQLSEQVPPQFSAVKQGGERAYAAARRGELTELKARPAGYRSIELLDVAETAAALPTSFSAPDWQPDPAGRSFTLPAELAPLPSALIRLEVSAGTYIRSFARDLGEALGSAAFLSGLARVRSGRVDLEQAVAADALAGAPGLTPQQVLSQPAVRLSAEEARRVRLGQRLPLTFAGTVQLLGPDGELVAIATDEDGRMKLLAVFAGSD